MRAPGARRPGQKLLKIEVRRLFIMTVISA